MRKEILIVTTLAILSSITGVLQATPTWSGSLSSANGQITDNGEKWGGTSTIDWEVTDNSGSYHYKYTLTVPDAPATPGISHFIIEVSEQFTEEDMENSTWSPTEVKLWTEGGSNPDLPASFRGLKFDSVGDKVSVTVEFDSERTPVWGDFYAVGGRSAIWNTGFIDPDTDPLYGPRDGTINDIHLLVPDTETTVTIIPAPGAVVLAGIGVGLVKLIRRRRTP